MNTTNNCLDAVISELQATGENISVTKQEIIESYLLSLDKQGVKRPSDPTADLEEKGALVMKGIIYTALANQAFSRAKAKKKQVEALNAEAINDIETGDRYCVKAIRVLKHSLSEAKQD